MLQFVVRALLAALFASAGVAHFTREALFVRMVPPWIPAPQLMVQLSGVCELVGALGLFIPSVRRAAGWGLVALLVAVFPANVHMAMHPRDFADMMTPTQLQIRLPLQLVLLALVWWSACATGTA